MTAYDHTVELPPRWFEEFPDWGVIRTDGASCLIRLMPGHRDHSIRCLVRLVQEPYPTTVMVGVKALPQYGAAVLGIMHPADARHAIAGQASRTSQYWSFDAHGAVGARTPPVMTDPLSVQLHGYSVVGHVFDRESCWNLQLGIGFVRHSWIGIDLHKEVWSD